MKLVEALLRPDSRRQGVCCAYPSVILPCHEVCVCVMCVLGRERNNHYMYLEAESCSGKACGWPVASGSGFSGMEGSGKISCTEHEEITVRRVRPQVLDACQFASLSLVTL